LIFSIVIDDENNNHINEKTPNERENDIDDYQNPNGEPFKKTKAKSIYFFFTYNRNILVVYAF
jgi:hypothetical protein